MYGLRSLYFTKNNEFIKKFVTSDVLLCVSYSTSTKSSYLKNVFEGEDFVSNKTRIICCFWFEITNKNMLSLVFFCIKIVSSTFLINLQRSEIACLTRVFKFQNCKIYSLFPLALGHRCDISLQSFELINKTFKSTIVLNYLVYNI